MTVELGQKYGKLTVVKRMHYRYYAQRYEKLRWKGQQCWMVVCDCGHQFSWPEGRITDPPYPEVQACVECQPHIKLPPVPVGHTKHAGHQVVDELEASGLDPMAAYFEYLKRTGPPAVPTPAQLRALRILADPDLGLKVSAPTLRALEAHRWVSAGQITPSGRSHLDSAR